MLKPLGKDFEAFLKKLKPHLGELIDKLKQRGDILLKRGYSPSAARNK